MKVTFSTPQGAVDGDFAADQPLNALKAEVLAKLRLPAAWLDQYVVAQDDKTLDETKSLNDLGIGAESTLVVWRVASNRPAAPPDRPAGEQSVSLEAFDSLPSTSGRANVSRAT